MTAGSPREAEVKHSEATMLALLRARYSGMHGNGQRYVFATHVHDAAGFSYTRTADAVAVDLWPSKGLEIHGHEVKVSRSDWLRELREPEKATAVRRYCDRWWLVVPDRDIVNPGELPDGWGLLYAAGNALRTAVVAPKLTPEPLARTFAFALLRASVKTERTLWERAEAAAS